MGKKCMESKNGHVNDGLPPPLIIAKSLAAGGIAGGISRTAVAPLERLKILLQVQHTSPACSSNPKYTGVWQGLRLMAQREGLRGMFKGNGANCLRIVPNSAVKFLTYEQTTRVWMNFRRDRSQPGEEVKLSAYERLGAGAAAGIVAMSATYSLDMVRGRLTVQESGKPQYRGIWHAATTIIRTEGVLALYKGWLPSVIGVVPYVGLNFAVYETLKAEICHYSNYKNEQDIHILARLGCGAIAGSIGQTVAYPLDVVRRRLQSVHWLGTVPPAHQMSGWEGHGGAAGVPSVAYRGMGDCFVRTVQEEGVLALFKGLWPNYIKVVPSIAIAFVTYEQVKIILGVTFKVSD